jgi:hypothetical protein
MNLDNLQRKLIAAARARPPSDAVPYGFEGRIVALIKTSAAVDHWALWARALWRAAAPCIAVTLLLAAWSLFTASRTPIAMDVSQDFENTILAAAVLDQPPADFHR